MLGIVGEAFLTLRPKLDEFARDVQSGLDGMGSKLTSIGANVTAITAPLAGISSVAIKTAIDFESSFAGIRKTMDLTEDEFGRLAAANRNLAQEIPLSVNEINRIGELAGQLGIRGVENVLLFERTIADLAVTTNLTSEEAALAFAQIANIMQLPQSDIDRLGSTVVDLGNNFATVESKIVDFALRIAGAGAAVGLSTSDVAAIGTAFASLGVEAEAGGTAVQKVLLTMLESVTLGNGKLETFAETAGLSVEEFSRLFREDASGAFLAFVEGLGLQGDQAIRTLNALDLKDQRLIRAFLAAAGAGDLMRESIERGTAAWAENTALTNEAEQRYATAESQLGLFRNRLQDIAITLGGVLVPAMLASLDRLDPLISLVERAAEAFANADPAIQTLILGITGIATAAGPVLIVAGTMMRSISALIPLFTLLTGPVGLIAAALAALAIAGVLVYTNWDELVERFPWLQEGLDAVRDAFERLADRVETEVLPALAEFVDEVERRFTADLLPLLQEAAQIAGQVFAAAVDFIGAHWAEITAVVEAAIALVSAIIETGMQLFRDIVAVGMALIEGDWSGAWEALKTLATNLLENIVDVATAKLELLLAVFTLIWELLPEPVQGALETIYRTVTSVLASVVDTLTATWETVRDTTVAVWTEISTFLVDEVWNSRIGQELRLTLDQWREWIGEAWDWVRTKTSEVWGDINEALREAWNSELLVELRITLDKARDWIGSAWDWVRTKTTEAWNAISDELAAVWGAIRTAIELQLGIITGAIRIWFDVTKEVFSTAWEVIKTIVGTQLDIIEDIIVGFLKVLRGDIDGAMTEVQGIFRKGWNAVKEVTGEVLGGVKGVVGTVWGEIEGTVNGAVSRLKTMLSTAWFEIRDTAGTSWRWFREGIESTWDSLAYGIRSIANRIISYVNSMIGGLESAVRGVANAINSIPDVPSVSLPGIGHVGGWGLPHMYAPYLPRVPYLRDGALDFAGGLAIVGEAGPELVSLPRGSRVDSNQQLTSLMREIRDALAASDRDAPTVIEVHTHTYVDGKHIDERIERHNAFEQTTGARLAGGSW